MLSGELGSISIVSIYQRLTRCVRLAVAEEICFRLFVIIVYGRAVKLCLWQARAHGEWYHYQTDSLYFRLISSTILFFNVINATFKVLLWEVLWFDKESLLDFVDHWTIQIYSQNVTFIISSQVFDYLLFIIIYYILLLILWILQHVC